VFFPSELFDLILSAMIFAAARASELPSSGKTKTLFAFACFSASGARLGRQMPKGDGVD